MEGVFSEGWHGLCMFYIIQTLLNICLVNRNVVTQIFWQALVLADLSMRIRKSLKQFFFISRNKTQNKNLVGQYL